MVLRWIRIRDRRVQWNLKPAVHLSADGPDCADDEAGRLEFEPVRPSPHGCKAISVQAPAYLRHLRKQPLFLGGIIHLWTVEGARSRILPGRSECVTGLLFSPDNDFLLSRARVNSTRLWDAVAGRLIVASDPTQATAFSKDGQRIAFSQLGQGLGTWKIHGGDADQDRSGDVLVALREDMEGQRGRCRPV